MQVSRDNAAPEPCPGSRIETIAVIDFETTGMAPASGGRATEIAAVLVEGDEVVARFQSLMNSGAWVPPFVEQLTGISNRMLDAAPPSRAVMHEVARFTRGCPLVAHNAAFDRAYWRAEMARAGVEPPPQPAMACTVLLARRLYPEAPNHRLGTLSAWHALPASGRAHRALADAETTAQLLLRIKRDLRDRFAAELGASEISHALLAALQRCRRAKLAECVRELVGATAALTPA
jgi:DNA polymerase III subunit epsilon